MRNLEVIDDYPPPWKPLEGNLEVVLCVLATMSEVGEPYLLKTPLVQGIVPAPVHSTNGLLDSHISDAHATFGPGLLDERAIVDKLPSVRTENLGEAL